MKVKENQEVRSNGILSLILLVTTFAFVGIPVWNGDQVQMQDRTLRRAEILAYQLLEGKKSPPRNPSSESEKALNHFASNDGKIGLDPWGHPYHFKFLKSKDTIKTKIIVWSLGPNGISDTSDEFINSNQDIHFTEDDLGIIVSVK